MTLDDAMDVIAEEHREGTLQIATVGSGDSASDDSDERAQLVRASQYWVVVWGIASCIMATVLGTALGSAHLVVFPMCAMPLVLLAASRMVSFVKNYFPGGDGHDDEPKPYLGFFFQSTGHGPDPVTRDLSVCPAGAHCCVPPMRPCLRSYFTGCF